jgi:hypothetical protein
MKKNKKDTRADEENVNPLTTRLTFSYSEDKIQLVSKRTFNKIPPVSDRLISKEREIGSWFEVKDARNITLFRRVIQNPMKQFAEIRSDNANRPFTWEKVNKPSGVFVIQFPEIEEATEVVLFSAFPRASGKDIEMRVIVRYSVKNNEIIKED